MDGSLPAGAIDRKRRRSQRRYIRTDDILSEEAGERQRMPDDIRASRNKGGINFRPHTRAPVRWGLKGVLRWFRMESIGDMLQPMNSGADPYRTALDVISSDLNSIDPHRLPGEHRA